MKTEMIAWEGEANRIPEVLELCDCGTCKRAAPDWAIGTLSFSNAQGAGVTIWLDPEAFVAARLASVQMVAT